MSSPGARTARRSTTFFSSRTLPGHRYASSRSSASGVRRRRATRCVERVRLEKVLQQLPYIVGTLPERRHFEEDDVESIVKVGAELPRFDALRQVAVGGGDDPHVDALDGAVGTDALQLAGLEKAQQQRLHAEAHFAGFVQKRRAVVGAFKQTRLVAIRVGKAAAHMTE